VRSLSEPLAQKDICVHERYANPSAMSKLFADEFSFLSSVLRETDIPKQAIEVAHNGLVSLLGQRYATVHSATATSLDEIDARAVLMRVLDNGKGVWVCCKCDNKTCGHCGAAATISTTADDDPLPSLMHSSEPEARFLHPKFTLDSLTAPQQAALSQRTFFGVMGVPSEPLLPQSRSCTCQGPCKCGAVCPVHSTPWGSDSFDAGVVCICNSTHHIFSHPLNFLGHPISQTVGDQTAN
jgi:hypothetical protein